MRLFLSSYRFGSYGDLFVELVGEEAKIGVITNAKDYKELTERIESVKDVLNTFQDIGLHATELDLRNYFDDPDGLEQELENYDVIWVSGGNTFVLRRALRVTGADDLIHKKVLKNELIYAGESAGAVIAAPTLTGVEFGDDPDIVPVGYPDIEVWDGLGLIPYSIVPHYESDWEGYERMMDTLEEADIPYKTLNDSQVIVVSGDEEERLP